MSIHLNEKMIAGKMIRTNNQQIEDIIALWNIVPAMNLSGELYAVYTNYESNFKGDYDLLIGSEQADYSQKVVINSGEYVAIKVDGQSPEAVGQAWQQIWQDEGLEKRRTYQTDVEHYQKDGTIMIYLSV
ncbi:GyrI-like domain-containing protein [Enterococcus sp. DIV0242_7C1]|uniref:Integron-associated effector binding protein domain-containing protein n=1 Tax=Candidatus Enterococcus dunnyi TaxID=1834192 RepID=A0A200J903_9ENTE|nr:MULTISPECIES: GyrI-like domain-containing protein [unclassified Enterococcus]MBO0471402.1 GyrI-like domain-containing protein [Enterococcus sp. DIV0242_7C1]OUZ33664.1 hypothetical protein A5889_002379 [Enterococcus sp. 9D6_DIV0238]